MGNSIDLQSEIVSLKGATLLIESELPKVVVIVGQSSSGKTTAARYLKEQIIGFDKYEIVSIDEIIRQMEQKYNSDNSVGISGILYGLYGPNYPRGATVSRKTWNSLYTDMFVKRVGVRLREATGGVILEGALTDFKKLDRILNYIDKSKLGGRPPFLILSILIENSEIYLLYYANRMISDLEKKRNSLAIWRYLGEPTVAEIKNKYKDYKNGRIDENAFRTYLRTSIIPPNLARNKSAWSLKTSNALIKKYTKNIVSLLIV